MTMTSNRTTQKGFTILEFLLASALFGFVLLGMASIYNSNQVTYTIGQGKIEARQNARISLEMMAREVRLAGHDLRNTIASQAQPTAIQTATSTSLTFLADVNNDNTLDKITYRLQGTQLLRDLSAWNGTSFPTPATGVVADSVSSLSFTYYDGTQPTNNLITAPVAAGSLGTIRRIQIGVVGSQRVGGGGAQTYSVVTDVRLRNL